MQKKPGRSDRAVHLWSGLTLLAAWIGVVIVGILVFKEDGLLPGLLKIREGELLPLLLVSASVLLLALVLKSFWSYFQGTNIDED